MELKGLNNFYVFESEIILSLKDNETANPIGSSNIEVSYHPSLDDFMNFFIKSNEIKRYCFYSRTKNSPFPYFLYKYINRRIPVLEFDNYFGI